MFAANLNDIPTTVIQPDKTDLNCLASGDEFHNWLHDADGYTIIQSPTSGFYCYAEKRDGKLVAGDLIPGRDNPQTRGLRPHLNISRAEYLSKRSTWETRNQIRQAPVTGNLNNIVIYIRFSDQTGFNLLTSSQNALYNDSSPGAISLQSYFYEESYGQLNVTTHLLPTQTGSTIVSYQDPHPRSYYSPINDVTNPGGYTSENIQDRALGLFTAATAYVSSMIPAGLNIDINNDNYADNVVFFIRAGSGAWGEFLWPHKSNLSSFSVPIGSKMVGEYNLAIEYMAGLSVQCHEFTHTMGAPDLYHYNDDGRIPVGVWDIMSHNTIIPQHCSAYLKYHFIGWITNIPTVAANQVNTLSPLTSATGNAFRVNTSDPFEFFILEYRRQTGRFESSLPGSGLIVWRINANYSGNAGGPPDGLYVFRPNASSNSNGFLDQAFFSQESGRTVFNDSTNPNCILTNGSSGGFGIQNVGSASESISFFCGSKTIDFEVNPDLQDFEGAKFPPFSWTNETVYGGLVMNRTDAGTYPECEPYSGDNMVVFQSGIFPASFSASLSSPKIAVNDHGSARYAFSLWMNRDSGDLALADRVEVYRNTSAHLNGSEALLGTVNRSMALAPVESVPGWHQYRFLLNQPANGIYYIIVKATSAEGNDIYLDDFAFTRHCYSTVSSHLPELNATNVSINPTLSWQAINGTPTGYRISLGTDNPPSNLIDHEVLEGVNSFVVPKTLCADTKYYWQVTPYDAFGDGYQPSILSFTTAGLSAISPPYLEDFEESPIYALPAGWKVINSNNDIYNWTTQISSTATSGLQFIAINGVYNGVALDDWAICRGLNLIGGQTYHVSFRYKRYGSAGIGKLALYYSNSNDPNNPKTLLFQNENITDSFVYATCELDFTPASSSVYYLMLYAYSLPAPGNFSFPGICVDDFNIRGVSPLELTNPLPASGSSGVPLDSGLSWEVASGTPAGYYMHYGTDNPPTNIANRVDIGNVLSWTPPVALIHNTSYYWQVVPYDAQGEAMNCPVWNFYSASDQIASQLPLLENFDAVTVPDLPLGWVIEEPFPYYNNWETAIENPYSSPNCVRIKRQFSIESNVWLISPAIKLYALTNYQLRYRYRTQSNLYAPEKMLIAYGNAPSADFLTNVIYDNDDIRSGSYQQMTLDFSPATTGDYYFGFKSYSESNHFDYYMYLDNIEFVCMDLPEAVSNPYPATLTSNVVVNDNTLSWEHEGDVVGYKISIGTDNPPTNILENLDLGLVGSYTHLTLWDFATQYYWQVVPYNSVGDCLDPEVYSFSTMTSSPISEYPYQEDFQEVAAPQFPDGYFTADANGDGIKWLTVDSSGAKKLRVTASTTEVANDWLFLPGLQTETGAYYQIDFLYQQTTLRKTGRLSVYYGSSPVPAAMTNVLYENAAIPRSVVALLAQEGFVAPPGGIVYIGFYFWSNAGQGSLTVDDIHIYQFPAQVQNPSPANNALGIVRNPVFSWDVPQGSPEGYLLSIGTDNPPSNILNMQDIALVNELQLIQSLEFEQQYYWQVVPYNAQGLTPECPVFSFRTMPQYTLLDMPYIQSFDALLAPELPLDWVINDVNADGTTWLCGTAFPRSAPNNARIGSSSQHMNDWFFLPPMYFARGLQYRLSFYSRQGSPTKTDALKLYYGSSATPEGMDVSLLSFSLSSTSYSLHQVTFSPTVSAAYYLGFHGDSNANQGLILIDDLSVQLISDPFSPPQSLTALAGENCIALSWQAPASPGQSSYKIYRDGMMIASIPGDQTGYSDVNVVSDLTYVYYLKAVYTSPSGISEESNYAVATLSPAGIPLAPTGVTIAVSMAEVNIQWQPVLLDDHGNPVSITSYQIYASDVPGFVPSALTLIGTSTSTQYLDTDPQQKRFYRIIAIRQDRSLLPD